MEGISSEIVLALGATVLFGSWAFKMLVTSIIKLNDELQETISQRLETEKKRLVLLQKIQQLELTVADLERKTVKQDQTIRDLQKQLVDCIDNGNLNGV